MSDNASTGTEGDGQVQETATTDTGSENKDVKADTVDALPEWARTLISNLRTENANHRTKAKEKVESTKTEVATEFEAKLAESNTAHESTKGELRQASLYLAKLTAVLEANVPSDKVLAVASRVNGESPEDIAKDVETVKALFGLSTNKDETRVPATDPSQGKGPSTQHVSEDEFTNFMVGLFGEQN